MPEGFVSDIDDEILSQVMELAKKSKASDVDDTGAPAPAYASYLEQLVRYATGEDELWAKPELLLRRAEAAWRLSAVRAPSENLISLRVDEGKSWTERRLVLDIVTEDMPFIVDSVSAALADAGKPVSFFSNAVIAVARREDGTRDSSGAQAALRESMIHAEMDPPVSDGEIEALQAEIETVLADVNVAVADWEPMRARLGACIAQLEKSRIEGVRHEEQKEAIEFLKWLWDNRFAFLGVRRFSCVRKDGKVEFTHQPDLDLGILRDPERRILNSTYQPDGKLSPAVAAFLDSNEPLIVAKANAKSLVHRRVFMDYVGVKSFGVDGSVTGEDRFVGLFTADAYNRPATDIPLVRMKVRSVIDNALFSPGGHNEKALVNILETFPRDDLFQMDVDSLRDLGLNVLRLYKRPRVKLFVRRDRFDRFVTALVFVPRDRFNSEIREQIGALLAKAYGGRVISFSPFFGDAALVRVHFILSTRPDAPEDPSVRELTLNLRALCRNWSDDLLEAMRTAYAGSVPAGLFAKYEKAFTEGYKERCEMQETLHDIAALERLETSTLELNAYRRSGDGKDVVRLKIYKRGEPLPLSKLIPTLENLGLNVIQEAGYKVTPGGDANGGTSWLHDFHTTQAKGRAVELEDVKASFEETIRAVLEGRTEDDGFNALVLTAGVNWREVWALRAAARHHLQSGFQYSLAYIEEALANHPLLTRDLVAAFHARFNPQGPDDPDARLKEVEQVDAKVIAGLEEVASLDEDLIIRRFLNLFTAMTRTNFYQRLNNGAPKPYISFKIDSGKLAELPEPKPYREIFVSGPRVDGVHLRFGPVARGGLRWSDRREDFRTEVLGLVKAQRVKNAVIVPTGSKGGFYPKQLPETGDRSAVYEEGREAYKEFIRGLLDLTDNIVKGEIVAPPGMVRWDDPDPYLVVAADKGTAQFSDTANAISADYGFWLGDAFASGGSAGYDHKAMGITARGAWEAVKRHFREIGKDIQTEPFTAAGVGDMSGDVFGNGMLLSEKTRLIAAFDHRDIFIDPDPDPDISYKERKRLFDMQRSSWRDYDPTLISAGGGVFSRSAKSIAVTAQMGKILGVGDKTLTPNELIRAILKAPVELFWLGGIGAYFKAEGEEDWRVGDRANDAVRIPAGQAGAQVIGEGANLGVTQLGRIEYARKGGRINTDAIDNSAGVDSSDHEVNIKILLSAAIENGALEADKRNALLASMTDDVAEHVLIHNYDQTRAISQVEKTAAEDLDAHSRFISVMEREGRLDRAIEFLPDAETIAMLRQQGQGLTRPELSVLAAYAKLWLFDELVQSDALDDPLFEHELFVYFPKPLHGFRDAIVSHRLRREIIATRLSNEIIDTCGFTFVGRAAESTGADFTTVALAYEAARRIYALQDFAAAVNALDNKAPADAQNDLYLEASALLRNQAFHLLSDADCRAALAGGSLGAVIERYHEPAGQFRKALPQILSAAAAKAMNARTRQWTGRKIPKALAQEAAALPALEHTLAIIDLSKETGWSNAGAGAIFFAVGGSLFIDALRRKAHDDPPEDHFDKMAIRQLCEDMTGRQRWLAKSIIGFAGAEPQEAPSAWAPQVMAKWVEALAGDIDHYRANASLLDLAGPVSTGKYALFMRKLDELCAAAESLG